MFLIAYFLKAEHVGWYALATSITEAFLYLPKALSNVVLVETATKFKNGVTSNHHLIYQGMTLIIGAATIGIAILAPFLIPLIFSNSFIPSITPLLLLLPGTLAMALGIIAAYHLFGLGKAFQPSLAALIATVITVVLDLLLIPWLGIPGAALASTFAYTAFLIICLYSVLVESDMGVKSLLIPTKQDLETLLTIAKKVWPHGYHPPV
jgi:O-antigen/teichoic acid export membrane protein